MMLSIRSILLIALPLASLCQAHDQKQSHNDEEATQLLNLDEIVNWLPEESVRSALVNNLAPKFRDGVFEHDRKAIESIHSADPQLATRLVDQALHQEIEKQDLRKRQNGNNSSTTASPQSSNPPPAQTSSTSKNNNPPPASSTAGSNPKSSNPPAQQSTTPGQCQCNFHVRELCLSIDLFDGGLEKSLAVFLALATDVILAQQNEATTTDWAPRSVSFECDFQFHVGVLTIRSSAVFDPEQQRWRLHEQ